MVERRLTNACVDGACVINFDWSTQIPHGLTSAGGWVDESYLIRFGGDRHKEGLEGQQSRGYGSMALTRKLICPSHSTPSTGMVLEYGESVDSIDT